MSWGEIPEELLTTIFQNLTKNVYRPADLYRCLNVCQSWRIVAKEVLQSSPVVVLFLTRTTQKPNTLLFNTSLLNSHKSTTLALNNINISSSDDNIDTIRVSGLAQELSNNRKLTTYASHGGWLLLGYRVWELLQMFLLNPVSRVIIRLPQLSAWFLNFACEIYFVMSETSPTDRKCIVCISNYIDFVASCKPAKWRTTSWVLCKKPPSSRVNIRSMIFCRDNFYTLDYDGALFKHSGALLHVVTNEHYRGDKRWCWPVNENKVAAALTPDDNDFHVPYESGSFAVYLVKSSKSGELLMVHRVRSKLFTSGFCVYKFTPRAAENINGCWKKTNSLGENEALIMGCTHDYISISVSSTMQTYKPNCIYFYDQIPGTAGISWGYGMYNLERGHIKYWDDFQSSSSDDNSAAAGKYCSSGIYHAEPRLFTPSVPSSSVNIITYLRRVMLGVKKICTKLFYRSSSCNQ